MIKKEKSENTNKILTHPGETILEVIQDREITQKELAIKTGVTEKYISTIIKGEEAISRDFAKKLELVLDIPASFWQNLQKNFDEENSENII